MVKFLTGEELEKAITDIIHEAEKWEECSAQFWSFPDNYVLWPLMFFMREPQHHK